ncbi:MAG: hypothetical protein WC533_01115 [Candidatus Pacearchaeota archaeon]
MGKTSAEGKVKEEKDENELGIFEMSNISLMLNSYDDIFSSFDPRHDSEKALSVDFLDEAKRASRDQVSGDIELRLLIPKKLRDINREKAVKKRLREHFQKHHSQIRKQYRKIIANGIIFITTGVLIMLMATFISFKLSVDNFLGHFLIIFLEPGGWFFFWEGLYQIIFDSKQKKPDLDFYEKMAGATIHFLSY